MTGIGDDDGQVLRRAAAGRNQLQMPVFADDARLVNAKQFEIGVSGDDKGGAHAKQKYAVRFLHLFGAIVKYGRVHDALRLLQGLHILPGDFADDFFGGIAFADLILRKDHVLILECKFNSQTFAEVFIAMKA